MNARHYFLEDAADQYRSVFHDREFRRRFYGTEAFDCAIVVDPADALAEASGESVALRHGEVFERRGEGDSSALSTKAVGGGAQEAFLCDNDASFFYFLARLKCVAAVREERRTRRSD